MSSPAETTTLPACDYRVEMASEDLYGCRHTSVRAPGNQVTAEICRGCSMRTVPCDQPRSVAEVSGNSDGVSWAQAGWNAAHSAVAFARDRFRTVSEEEYAARTAVCDECDRRSGNRCLECGCRLSLKARGRTFRCPLGKWPELVNSNVPEEIAV